MSAVNAIAAVASVALGLYLAMALLKPEWFQ